MNPKLEGFIVRFANFLLALPFQQPQVIQMPDGSHVPLMIWNGPVRAVVHNFNIGNTVMRLKFLEQNPNKPGSKYAQMALNGDKIVWVISPGENGQQDYWLGRVHNGKWVPNS